MALYVANLYDKKMQLREHLTSINHKYSLGMAKFKTMVRHLQIKRVFTIQKNQFIYFYFQIHILQDVDSEVDARFELLHCFHQSLIQIEILLSVVKQIHCAANYFNSSVRIIRKKKSMHSHVPYKEYIKKLLAAHTISLNINEVGRGFCNILISVYHLIVHANAQSLLIKAFYKIPES